MKTISIKGEIINFAHVERIHRHENPYGIWFYFKGEKDFEQNPFVVRFESAEKLGAAWRNLLSRVDNELTLEEHAVKESKKLRL